MYGSVIFRSKPRMQLLLFVITQDLISLITLIDSGIPRLLTNDPLKLTKKTCFLNPIVLVCGRGAVLETHYFSNNDVKSIVFAK